MEGVFIRVLSNPPQSIMHYHRITGICVNVESETSKLYNIDTGHWTRLPNVVLPDNQKKVLYCLSCGHHDFNHDAPLLNEVCCDGCNTTMGVEYYV